MEAQKEFYPGYSIITRGIFYGARMLSAQKGIEFTGRDYDNIRKVYSIWICMNAPDYIGNAISYYHIQKEDTIPGIPDKKETYDKLTVVTICLNSRSEKSNRLTKMLGVLLSPRLDSGEKIHQLEYEFDIPMENDMGEELNQMCNLSDYVVEIGLKEGREQGIKQGMEQGIKQGIEQGIKQGIEQGIKQGIEQGIEQGIQQGKEQLLTQQVAKKHEKGKSVQEIADELEEDEKVIRRILEKL